MPEMVEVTFWKSQTLNFFKFLIPTVVTRTHKTTEQHRKMEAKIRGAAELPPTPQQVLPLKLSEQF